MSQRNEILQDLKDIYADVSEWLKFAEAKHTAALAFLSAVIVAVLSTENFYKLDIIYQRAIIILLLLGLLINIFSFLPFTNNIKLLKNDCYRVYSKEKGNLIFYKSIFVSVGSPDLKLSDKVNNYKNFLKQEYGQKPQGKLITDYIIQIIQVATVASIKTFLFSIIVKYIVILIILAVLFAIML